MRFLIDENAPVVLVELLTERGHDAVAIARLAPSDSDDQVLERARDEDRIIVTLDLDFGALIYRDAAAAPAGVVQLRGRPDEVDGVVRQFIRLLDSATATPLGHFIVIDAGGALRQLPLNRDISNA